MTQQVKVIITTTITQEQESQQIKQNVLGEFVVKPKASYLRYQEEKTQTQPPAQVVFKFQNDGSIFLQRKQADGLTRLAFKLNEETLGSYQFGNQQLVLKVKTTKQHQILSTLAPGNLTLDYQLFFDKQLLGEYKIRLQFML